MEDAMPLERFDPPGFVDDLDATQKQAWSDWVSNQLDVVRDRDGSDEGLVRYGPRPQFFNPLQNAPASDAVEKDITWTAFPRILKITSVSDVQRWRKADNSRDAQDEYCEWSVVRDPETHKLAKVTFTSEAPEYWEFLAAVNPERTLQLYREHVDSRVEHGHLFGAAGAYNPRNRWNQSTEGGAMHLIQANNTLGAEIELAGAATIVRRRNGVLVTAEQELIECGAYGQAERFSDPHIGAEVNALARQKADVTLANPVGLCIGGLSVAGWQTPDGSDPASYWRVTRGTTQKAVRAVYEVPAEKGFVVGDITIGGRKIDFAGQIADFITIKLTGMATRLGQSTVAPVDGCVSQREAAGLEAFVRAPSVAAVLARRSQGSRR
jgi:hypothetical protein